MTRRKFNPLTIIGPGILIAATGVGAGDLATGAFTGSKLGVAVLWAVVVGAGLKFVLNEGLARWQLATGSTLLEGAVAHLGRPARWLFLGYLLIWSFFVGSALMSACGVTAHAMLPLWDSPNADKIVYGLLHSAAAVVLVRLGGYRLFGKVMGVCIAMMFVVVVTTAARLTPSWAEVGAGLVPPTISEMRAMSSEEIQWTVALMGGIGGTLTILCYGYWIREEGRRGTEDLRACRIDLATGYAMTALFGIGIVIIGNTISGKGTGIKLVVDLAEQLKTALGSTAKWAFLVGAWGAVFSSLLGVWQSVPYLFADFWALMRDPKAATIDRSVDTKSRPYQVYLFALATIPAVGLWTSFERAQKLYAIVGAMFIPILAVVLLILCGQSRLVGRRYRNSVLVTLLLIGSLAFFVLVGWFEIQKKLSG